MTNSKRKHFGTPGTFLNWEIFSSTGREERTPTFHGKAIKSTILQSDGACQRQNRILVFTSEYTSFLDCMEYCKKLGTRCPSVKPSKELLMLHHDVQRSFPWNPFVNSKVSLWLPVTQGKMVSKLLLRFDHWTEGLEVREGIWRDYYTGKQLDNYTKP